MNSNTFVPASHEVFQHQRAVRKTEDSNKVAYSHSVDTTYDLHVLAYDWRSDVLAERTTAVQEVCDQDHGTDDRGFICTIIDEKQTRRLCCAARTPVKGKISAYSSAEQCRGPESLEAPL